MTAPGLGALERSVVMVGLMGAGKTAIGKRLAARLGVPFVDADAEIEAAAGCTIADIFAQHGEADFRQGERRVIARLLAGGPQVIATGGGAFMDADTRARIRASAISVWLKAELGVLVARCARRSHRPLLQGGDPEAVLATLMAARDPVYAEADIVVESREGPHDAVVDEVLAALAELAPRQLAGAPTLVTVPVALGERSYEVVVGEALVPRAAALLEPVIEGRRVAVVSDARVAEHHLEPLCGGLEEAGLDVHRAVVPAGEGSKSFAVLERLLDDLLAARIERSDTVIALGGGVVGDLAGFAASILRRGVPLVQVPTTLLAQVDSAVGGKTGIDTRFGKNLVGSFHQPRLVIADVATLDTLPERELRAGYAEVVKYGLIDDAPFFAWLEARGPAVLAGDRGARRHAVRRSCAAKARIVAADERETGRRALLNLGHTFAHALEVECGYGEALRHGEAVAIGMTLAFALSARLGLCPEEDADTVRRHLAASGLPTSPAGLVAPDATGRLLAHMAQDKKVRAGRVAFVLARGIGQAFVSREVDMDAVRALIADALGEKLTV